MKTILALALAFAAATASAKSFLIERIDVNAAKRIPAAAVLAETRLDAGKTYTEEQLEQALARVRRLPFVLFANADLKPGATPEARVLRINIEETSNFNWNIDTSGIALSHDSHGTYDAHVGYRFFPGAHGTLDAIYSQNNMSYVSPTGRAVAIAYDAYGLLGTRAYGSAGVGTVTHSSGGHDVNPSLLLGLPLTRTQSIEARFARTTSRLERNVTGLADPVRSSARITTTGLSWLFLTADDPYFARTGFDIVAGPSWERDDLHLPFVLTRPLKVIPGDQDQRIFVLAANAAKYWPLRESSVAWGRLGASSSHLTGTSGGHPFPADRRNEADVLLGLAHNFNHDLGESSQGRTRLELGLGYHLDNIASQRLRKNNGPEAELGLTFRNRYGLFRLSVAWVAH